MIGWIFPAVVFASAFSSLAQASKASQSDFERGLAQVEKLAGCYVVDYSFAEIEALKPGYVLDKRVYDVNLGKTTRELVLPIRKSSTEVRLQHVLFTTDAAGKTQFVMKHQAEDWSYEAPFLYDFKSPGAWDVKSIVNPTGMWTRKVTNLDDGLRYQCAAPWNFQGEQPQWECANLAPIPGRETRDMGRKDYNALDRVTHLIDYGASFLERQRNVKTILEAGVQAPLVREVGKIWFVRQPAIACDEARRWATPRLAFWKILMEEWESIFAEELPVREKSLLSGKQRYAVISEIEERYFGSVGSSAADERTARAEIRAVLNESLGRQDGSR
jgi:hypothetical protein